MSEKKTEHKSVYSRKTRGTQGTSKESKQKEFQIDSELQNILGSYGIGSRNDFYTNEEIFKHLHQDGMNCTTRKLKERKNHITPLITHREVATKSINWRQSNFLSDKFFYGEFTLFFFSFIHLLTGIIYYEIDSKLLDYQIFCRAKEDCNTDITELNPYHVKKDSLIYVIDHKSELETASQLCLIFISIISLLSITSYICNQILFVNWQKSIQSINDQDNIIQTKSGPSFLLESLLMIVHPYFFLSDKIFSYTSGKSKEICILRTNYIFLSLFIPFRMWIIAKYFIRSSYFYSLRAQRLCKILKRDITFGFVVKSLIHYYPFFIIFICFFSIAFLGAYIFRIWEGSSNEDFKNFMNCIWFSVTTMLTVGYGKSMITSPMGKIVAILLTISTFCLFAILIFSVNNVFNFLGEEKKAFDLMNNLLIKEKMNTISKEVANICFKIIKLNKKKNGIKSTGIDEKENKEIDLIKMKIEKEMEYFQKKKEKLLKDIHFLYLDLKNISNLDFLFEISQNMDNALTTINDINILTKKFENLVNETNDTRTNLVNIQSNLQ